MVYLHTHFSLSLLLSLPLSRSVFVWGSVYRCCRCCLLSLSFRSFRVLCFRHSLQNAHTHATCHCKATPPRTRSRAHTTLDWMPEIMKLSKRWNTYQTNKCELNIWFSRVLCSLLPSPLALWLWHSFVHGNRANIKLGIYDSFVYFLA